MANIKAFRGLRPQNDLVRDFSVLPYDVVSANEARIIADGVPHSFFHVSKSEIDFPPDANPYDESIYLKARANLMQFINQGILSEEKIACLYLYTQIMEGRSQTGLIACINIDDYISNTIKKHELTREDKEVDRTRHLDIVNANTGPVFLMYKNKGLQNTLYEQSLLILPEYQFTSGDGITHIFRIIRDQSLIDSWIDSFKNEQFYIADGHHRAASAVNVGQLRRKENPQFTGNEEFNWFMGVIFPHDHLKIYPYNRLIKDLNGMNEDEFMSRLSESFHIQKSDQPVPGAMHEISMYIHQGWFTLKPSFDIPDDPIHSLDVSILQEYVLAKILGIEDPRTSDRIVFIGGIRGTKELSDRVDSNEFACAFSLYPTSIDQLIAVSDSNKIMPPKSTWFEPKLRSGLVIHSL